MPLVVSDAHHTVIQNTDGSAMVTERTIGFWLPVPTERSSASKNRPDGSLEGARIARQAVETMIGSLSLEPAKFGGALYTARRRK